MLPQIATPKYDMIVPSTGESIKYRPYLVKEEKILLIALESQDPEAVETAVLDIIKACIESPVDIKKLTTFDVEFMFVTLRSKSVGEGIKINPPCEHCEASNEVKINLDDVKVANLEEEVDKHIKLTDDISVDLKWNTMDDRLDPAEKSSETDTIINMVAHSIDTIYSGDEIYSAKDASKKELQTFVESLSSDQFTEIVNTLGKAPYLSYDIHFDCKECKKENVIELKGLTDFFQ
jgi:hypothetical protein